MSSSDVELRNSEDTATDEEAALVVAPTPTANTNDPAAQPDVRAAGTTDNAAAEPTPAATAESTQAATMSAYFVKRWNAAFSLGGWHREKSNPQLDSRSWPLLGIYYH